MIGSWLLDLTADGAAGVARARRLRRPRLGLGRGPLDVDRRDRGGRARAGAHHGALRALRLARPRRLRRQGALGDAQAVRRPRREGRAVADGPPHGHRDGGGSSRRRRPAGRRRDRRRPPRGEARAPLARRGQDAPRRLRAARPPGRRLGRSRALARGRAPRAAGRSRSRTIGCSRRVCWIAPGPSPTQSPPRARPSRPPPLMGASFARAFPPGPDGMPALDFALLGLGEDGHTASLFPDAPALDARGEVCVPVHDAPKPPPDRVSLTLDVLRASRAAAILAVGAQKAHSGGEGARGPRPTRARQPARRRADRADRGPSGRAGSAGAGPGVMARSDAADALVFFGATATSPTSRSFPRFSRMIRRGHLDMPIIGVAKSGWDLDRSARSGPTTASPSTAASTRPRSTSSRPRCSLHRRRLRRPGHLRRASRGARRRRTHPSTTWRSRRACSATVVSELARSGCAEGAKVMVEKPFGHDLESAERSTGRSPGLSRAARSSGSTTTSARRPVENLLYFRFANSFLEPIWNRDHVRQRPDHDGRELRRRRAGRVLRGGRSDPRRDPEPHAPGARAC